MRYSIQRLIARVLLMTFIPIVGLGFVIGSAAESIVPLFDAFGEEALAWLSRAVEDDPPISLTVSADGETRYWSAEIIDNNHIRSYLNAMEAMEVNSAYQQLPYEGALTMTYAFHMRDGSTRTILFQAGMAGFDLRSDVGDKVFPVVGAGGMEKPEADLPSLDAAVLAQLKVVEKNSATEQTQQTVQFDGDLLFLTLEENPTTGYLWSFSVEPESALVCVEEEYRPDKNSRDADGAGRERHYTFQAVSADYSILRLTRMGPDGSVANRTAFSIYSDETGITFVERMSLVLDVPSETHPAMPAGR